MKEGEKLSDILSMPIKDALGRDIDVDYSEDIANLREVLDAAKTRFKIFSDSLDIQKLTLEQITNIHSCEKDAETAIKWVESELHIASILELFFSNRDVVAGLYKVMLKSHTHVGCNVSEIQNQKDEHQAFQDTAKVSASADIKMCFEIALFSHQNATLCTEHIQLWHSASKCRICTSTIVQAQLRQESRDNRSAEEDLEESARCESGANDSLARLCCVLSQCRRALRKIGAVEGVSWATEGCGGAREENCENEKISGGS